MRSLLVPAIHPDGTISSCVGTALSVFQGRLSAGSVVGPLPSQPYMRIPLDVKGKRDENVSHYGRDDPNEGRPIPKFFIIMARVGGRSQQRIVEMAGDIYDLVERW